MKRLILTIVFPILFSPFIGIYADETYQINIEQVLSHGTHLGIPFIPADQPDVYYDDDTDEIIIDGTGYSTYYDVEIFCCDDGLLVLQDTVNGNYDTIDVSSLPDGEYQIVITSSYDNQYEGYFIKN